VASTCLPAPPLSRSAPAAVTGLDMSEQVCWLSLLLLLFARAGATDAGKPQRAAPTDLPYQRRGRLSCSCLWHNLVMAKAFTAQTRQPATYPQ